MSQRPNLRTAIVTNVKLIKKLKQTHPSWFFNVGYSVLLLRRYDGEHAKLDLTSADLQIDIPKWVSTKSTGLVDELNEGSF